MKKEKRPVFKILCIVVFTVLTSLPSHSVAAETKTLTIKELYELKERCGKTCAQRFKEEYGKESMYSKDGVSGIRIYNSHYNAKLNRCFILIRDKTYSKEPSTLIMLWDVNENKQYGEYFYMRNDLGTVNCWVLGKQCASEREWDSLVKAYMEE
jgi:hypothetical protein